MDLFGCDDDPAFLLRNLLLPAECDEVIAQAEALGFTSCGYSERVRVTDWVIVKDNDLGALLFEQACAYLGNVLLSNSGHRSAGVPNDILRACGNQQA